MFKKILLELLFPKSCCFCGQKNYWLCPNCFQKIINYQGEIPRLLENKKNLIIASEYQDPIINKLIIDFKFKGNQELARPASALIITELNKRILINKLNSQDWGEMIIIPLPLHKKRKRWRGFNQSELLAKEISNYYKWPLNLQLTKHRQTNTQLELPEEKRAKNQLDCFRWVGGEISEKTVLLIDDVITTGATMNEAEKVLLQAGAKTVIKVALAKG